MESRKRTSDIKKLYLATYDISLKRFILDNILLILFILIIPLLIFSIIVALVIIQGDTELLYSLVIGIFTYFGPIILSLLILYTSSTKEKRENKNKKINVNVSFDSFDAKLLEEDFYVAFNNYSSIYGLQVEPENQLNPLKLYGFKLRICNYSYEKIINCKVEKAYFCNEKTKYKKIMYMWGKRKTSDIIIDYMNDIVDFISIDEKMGIKLDNSSKVLIIYEIITLSHDKYFMFFEVTFCKVGIFLKKVILEEEIYDKFCKKYGNNVDSIIINELYNFFQC